MNKQLILIATAALFITSCKTTLSRMTFANNDVAKQTTADDQLFRDLLTDKGGISFADFALFPNVKERIVTNIKVIVPYDNHKTGVERWTIEHVGQGSCSYVVRFIPDGSGGTTFTVQKDNGTIKQ